VGDATISFKNSNTTPYSQLTESEKWTKCFQLSRLLVMINPDLAVAWNFRREAFNVGYSNLKEELQLVSLVASRKARCSEGFNYRRWLVRQALKTGMDKAQLINLFQNEAKAAFQAASKYFSNYHAWDYRLFLVETWLLSSDVPGEVKTEILDFEKEVSDTWLNSHISDHCGYHYRQKLLAYLVKFRYTLEESKELLLQELKENQGMLLFYAGHESLWYHRKNLIMQFLELYGKQDSDRDFSFLINNEYSLCAAANPTTENGDSDMRNNFPAPISDAVLLNRTYSERYLKWLQIVLAKYK